MPVHFGAPTLIEFSSVEQNLALCHELGLDFVELNMNLPEYQLDRIDAAGVKQKFQQYGKYPTIHLDENLNVCDFNTAVADAYLKTVIDTIALAKFLCAPVINMHMSGGVYFTLPERRVYLFERYQQHYYERLRRFRDICDAALRDGPGGILICVENCGIYGGFQQTGIDILLECPNFALTYDIGHDFCVGDGNKPFIMNRAGRLRHMHIHDASGNRNHLALGTGEINIADNIALAAAHDCRCVLEIKTAEALRQSAEYLKRENIRPASAAATATDDGICTHNPAQNTARSAAAVTNSGTNEAKLDLFMSLFRGREDVFALRWEKKDGSRSGYSPACRNEWRQGVCDKRHVRCSECKFRELIPLNREILRRHLSGKAVVGLYPLRSDENCLLLAMDFDGGDWPEDVAALRRVCKENDIAVSVERSRSGNGAHVWFFFEEQVSAYAARKFGSALLTAAMEQRHSIKFSSYDRLFPNQDTMPSGGFGNLIALPLQRNARSCGNSLFIDENLIPYTDQWAYLSALPRISPIELERMAATLGAGGDLGLLRIENDGVDDGSGDGVGDNKESEKPWRRKQPVKLCASDFPPEVQITEANMLYIDKNGMSGRALNRIKRLAAFKNPEFYRAQVMRLSTKDKPRIISISDETETHLILPRGCKNDIESLTGDTPITWREERNAGRYIDVEFNGVLRDEQANALTALLAHDNGILSGTTAFGKTVVAVAMIAERKVNTLVLVNRRQLLDQWKARLSEFLLINEILPEPSELPELPAKRGRKKKRSVIGSLGGGKNDLGGIVDIAIMQSLVRGDEVSDIVRNYGMVIVDECHHVSAVTFEQVLKETDARYVYGLTATPRRKDGHHPIIAMHCGEIRYRDDAKKQARNRPFEHYFIPRFTSYRLPPDRDDMRIQGIYSDICQNERRNTMIVSDVILAASEGRNSLVLTERKNHIEMLAREIREGVPDVSVIVLTGGQPEKERIRLMEMIAAVPDTEPLVIVATGKYVGEGFDVPRLDTLFLALPISWEGTLAQYAGRLHRLRDGKDEVRVYDYIDVRVPMLERMYAKRVKGYTAIGYSAKCEGVLPPDGNIIFDSVSFLPVFTADVLAAKRDILIVSPYLRQSRVAKMLDILDSRLLSGVKLTVVTRPVRDYSDRDGGRVTDILRQLRDKGITVVEKSRIHQKFAIFDGRIVWYGSINLLSFGKAEESVMRLESTGIANELMVLTRETTAKV